MASSDGAGSADLLRLWRANFSPGSSSPSGRDVRTIRRLQSGRPQRPTAGSLRLLADALGLTDHERTMLVSSVRPEASAAGVPHQLPAAGRHFVAGPPSWRG